MLMATINCNYPVDGMVGGILFSDFFSHDPIPRLLDRITRGCPVDYPVVSRGRLAVSS